ncbi:MAG: D-alanyl-D-alanine carboxypeptidase family protein, partial [Oscillospiraceae bacterium]|nr:D-alanyl-D-alanine carboxypeptidase family protein [Oscillospiraceae bacterium]
WLAQNAWRYGFIQRYPQGADEITGYSWHPWHYRYVGEGAAGNIFSLGITLEEYLSLFYTEEAQVVYEQP